MATLSELAVLHTSLERDDVGHVQRLVGEWGLLADFCFADLLLYAPSRDGRWVVLGQVRPVTSQTLYQADWVGAWASEKELPLLVAARDEGAICEGEVEVEGLGDLARVVAIPVRRGGRVVAVVTREWSPRVGRHAGELERTYLSIFRRLADMIADGSFPFPAESSTTTARPRVGDGVMALDADARVTYASPNAISALHRVGINANAIGLRLAELGFHDGSVRHAFERTLPVTEEFDQTSEITLVTRCIPLLAGGRVTGAVLLVRDVSEVRRRDRMLLSKDATIREIHHRVKNNLQTISSLLRLQGRRLSSPEAKAAINESVRRIRTIALVHETLSREAGDDVAFGDILRPLARMAEDSLQSPDRPVRFRVQGDGGKLPATVATPLAVVLNELLQNAVDHAFRGWATPGNVIVAVQQDDDTIELRVVDDGIGVPSDFQLEHTTGLGLSIVRTLVTTELAGTIELRPASGADLEAVGLAPPERGTGTVVELRIPATLDGR
jgi:two-component sensor histidine kinase